MGILLKEALDQTEQHDNSYQVKIHFARYFDCQLRDLALNKLLSLDTLKHIMEIENVYSTILKNIHIFNFSQLDLLLSSTLFIMDKVGPNSLNETSINPELMVRCIRYRF